MTVDSLIDLASKFYKRLKKYERKQYKRRNKIEMLSGEWITQEEFKKRNGYG